MPDRIAILALIFSTVFLVNFGIAQERGKPISFEDIEFLVKQGVSAARVGELIDERGISFGVTPELYEKLSRMGADAKLKDTVGRAAAEYVRRRNEDERKKKEEERRKAEEEKQRVEEERRRIDEAKQKEEEKRKTEEGRRKAEEKKKQDEYREMVLIPAGEFWMGSEISDRDAAGATRPKHRVLLDAFHIDKYEVTNGYYRDFMEGTGRTAPSFWNNSRFNEPTQPVVGVTWHDAEAYCKWVGKRLPTEAEWEKAARGTDERKYPWGNQWDSSKANADSKLGRSTRVGSYAAGVSPFGVYDLAGNGAEWVADWFDRDYYEHSPVRNPRGPDSGQFKVMRGGSWYSSPRFTQVTDRDYENKDSRSWFVGFRCAKEVLP